MSKLVNRNLKITLSLVNKKVLVHDGKIFNEFVITHKMIGYKIGQFCATKKKVVHKKKII